MLFREVLEQENKKWKKIIIILMMEYNEGLNKLKLEGGFIQLVV